METRQTPRLPISSIAKLKVDPSANQHFDIEKKHIRVQIIDISMKGIGLLCKYFIPRGVIIDLEFKVKDELIVVISGGVGLTRLGVKFVDINKEQKRIIEDFLKKNERRIQPRLGV